MMALELYAGASERQEKAVCIGVWCACERMRVRGRVFWGRVTEA